MIGFETAAGYYGHGRTIGERRRDNSDLITERMWDGDIQSRKAFLYDSAHDDEPDKAYGLEPQASRYKIPVDIKYIINTYNSDTRAQVSYHIQFKPSYRCTVDYYDAAFHRKCGSEFPIGLYIDIPDTNGIYRRYLIAETANAFNPQFPTWGVYPCDEKLMWVSGGTKNTLWGCMRMISSWSSGIWRDSKIETPEDQQLIFLPFCKEAESLYYNLRVIMTASAAVPLAWRVTKVNNLNPRGIVKLTFVQDTFDQHKDLVETDADGNITGAWADYYSSAIEPKDAVRAEPSPPPHRKAEMTYSGTKPQLKIGGTPRTFDILFLDGDETKTDPPGEVVWSYMLGGTDAGGLLEINEISDVRREIRFTGGDEYLGRVLTVAAESGGVRASAEVEIVGL